MPTSSRPTSFYPTTLPHFGLHEIRQCTNEQLAQSLDYSGLK